MVASAGRTWCPPGRWPRPVQSSVDTTTMTNEGNETTVQQTPSLYDRLGDVYNIVTVIDDLIDRGHGGRPPQCQSTGGRGPPTECRLRSSSTTSLSWRARPLEGLNSTRALYGRLAPPSRDHRAGVARVHGRPSADPQQVRRSATRARRAEGDHRVNPR
jgi:hypothetical protein